MWKNHPRGLVVLFFTEMWERFGFYTVLAILALYMDEHFKMPKGVSGNVYGIFVAFVYFTPMFGGLVADRWLGYSRSIVAGAVALALGYFVLAVDNMTAFYAALVIIVVGNGFFKPNISTMLGNLYGDHNPMKDSGFNIFYMGINIGAFFAPMAAAFFRNSLGWGWAFACAGVGMLVSAAIFLLFREHLRDVTHAKRHGTAGFAKLTPRQERNRILALIVVFVIVVFFWMAFYQNGFTLTFWARDCTNTSLSPELFQSANPLFVVAFTPILVWLWGRMRRAKKEPTTTGKILIGMMLTALAYLTMMAAGLAGGDSGRVSVMWLVSSYAIITLGELCLSPMGLSLVSNMSPPRMRGLMMGGWFAASAVGSYLSGFLGSYWERMPHSSFFGILVITSLVAVVLLALVMRRVNRAMEVAPELEIGRAHV